MRCFSEFTSNFLTHDLYITGFELLPFWKEKVGSFTLQWLFFPPSIIYVIFEPEGRERLRIKYTYGFITETKQSKAVRNIKEQSYLHLKLIWGQLDCWWHSWCVYLNVKCRCSLVWEHTVCDCVGISTIVICFQAGGKMNKQRVSHLKNGRVRGEKCGLISLAIDKSQGGHATDTHSVLLFPLESWTIHYKGLRSLSAKRRLNLVLCGFSHVCFAKHCSSCALFGNQTLCTSLILAVWLCVSVGRDLPEPSNPESKMMLTWSQPPSGTVWCCNMRGPWGKNLTRRCCICSPFFNSNVAFHQCGSWSCCNY